MPAKPSLGAYAADVAALADQLGLGQFSLFGVSGGGPYAAVTAALLAERVTALALVAPVGPIHGEADGEISRFHRFCFGQLARTPAAVGLVFGAFRWALAIAPNAGMRLAMVRIAASGSQP